MVLLYFPNAAAVVFVHGYGPDDARGPHRRLTAPLQHFLRSVGSVVVPLVPYHNDFAAFHRPRRILRRLQPGYPAASDTAGELPSVLITPRTELVTSAIRSEGC